MKASGLLRAVLAWFDTSATRDAAQGKRLDWLRIVPFALLHIGCVAVVAVDVSAAALIVAVALYALRMFAITAFYHRYFSHKAFRTSRPTQFLFAVLGALAVQRGPLWWASQHRHHHAHADDEQDVHSPRRHGLWWAHAGWFMSRASFGTRTDLVSDLMQYPELRFLDRFDVLVPLLLAAGLYGLGQWLALMHPRLGTSGAQLLVWGFCISTVVLYHVTFTINSLAHSIGRRRYATGDHSRNNGWLALLTFGEGWHNNHHRYPGAARQGFYWWEIDLTYYALRLLAATGLIWALRAVPEAIRNAREIA